MSIIPQLRLDQVIVLSNVPRRRLLQVLPVRRLRALAPSFRILEHGPRAAYFFRTKIAFTMPAASEFLQTLIEAEPRLGVHVIHNVEVARDTPCATVEEAIQHADMLGRSARRRWGGKEVEVKFGGGAPPPGCFRGARSYCVGDLIVYPRLSKPEQTRDARPIVREEIRIKGAANVRRRLGIRRLVDLTHAPLKPLFGRFVTHEQLDLVAIGGIFRPSVSDEGARQAAHLIARVQSYRTSENDDEFEHCLKAWETAARWRSWLRDERLRLRKRPGPRPRRSSWHHRLRTLSDSRLGRLFGGL